MKPTTHRSRRHNGNTITAEGVAPAALSVVFDVTRFVHRSAFLYLPSAPPVPSAEEMRKALRVLERTLPMRLLHPIVLGLAMAAVVLTGSVHTSRAEPPKASQNSLKPDVAALLKLSTEAYKKVKSYRHTALFVIEQTDPVTGASRKLENRYTLALERPNKFAYKNDTQPTAAAVSDGKTFINFKGDEAGRSRQYTQTKAPADFKGINIVDDVTFSPLVTYVIALLLQGDPLADKDVRASLEKATLKPALVTENGKKWQVLSMIFDQQVVTDIYFNAENHLIEKTLVHSLRSDIKIGETYENISIDKPIDSAVFQYTPPAGAKKIEKFIPAQNPNDARNTPRHNAQLALAPRQSNGKSAPRT